MADDILIFPLDDARYIRLLELLPVEDRVLNAATGALLLFTINGRRVGFVRVSQARI